eukprot:scaffold79176_cov60-Phaeocystis_antarctica.AAC.3
MPHNSGRLVAVNTLEKWTTTTFIFRPLHCSLVCVLQPSPSWAFVKPKKLKIENPQPENTSANPSGQPPAGPHRHAHERHAAILASSHVVTLPGPPPHLTAPAGTRPPSGCSLNPLVNPPGPPPASLLPRSLPSPAPASCCPVH